MLYVVMDLACGSRSNRMSCSPTIPAGPMTTGPIIILESVDRFIIKGKGPSFPRLRTETGAPSEKR